MVAGFACHFDGTEPEGVVAVVVGSKFKDKQLLRETLLSAPQGVLIVMAWPKRTGHADAEAEAREILEGRDVVFNPLNPFFKHARGDDRRLVCDCELGLYAERVIVFVDDTERSKWWKKHSLVNRKVKLVEPN